MLGELNAFVVRQVQCFIHEYSAFVLRFLLSSTELIERLLRLLVHSSLDLGNQSSVLNFLLDLCLFLFFLIILNNLGLDDLSFLFYFFIISRLNLSFLISV